ncbi:MAG TPA: enoyl-CoA hydratase-related protein [Turneriella sp.]|nr:enoyl-CoA hydratase-related protein [Turneriella sp.]
MTMGYQFFLIEKKAQVATLWLNRPEKRNFMNWHFWEELPEAIAEINNDDSIKVFIVAAKGASFSIGLDLPDFVERFYWLGDADGSAENNLRVEELVLTMQKGMRALADSPKPSIAAVQRHCIGGGLDLVAACDIRYASSDVIFSLREVKVAIVADMGSLQRLPHIIGEGATRELALTGRDVGADEALRLGLVTRVLPDKEALYAAALKTAEEMASNPAVVMRGVKYVLDKQRGMDIGRSLDFVALYNGSYLQSKEFVALVKGFAERKKKS